MLEPLHNVITTLSDFLYQPFIVPLLLLVQLSYEAFLQGVAVPAAVLVVSVAVCAFTSFVCMRKFASM